MAQQSVKSILFLSVLARPAPPAQADTYFPTDTTINYAVSGNAIIGEDGMGGNTSPTVDLVTGGSIDNDLFVDNSSVLNISGGSVGIALIANDSSSVNVSAGTVGGNISFSSTGTLDVSNGNIGIIYANNGTTNISGGTISFLDYSSTVNLYGGQISSFEGAAARPSTSTART